MVLGPQVLGLGLLASEDPGRVFLLSCLVLTSGQPFCTAGAVSQVLRLGSCESSGKQGPWGGAVGNVPKSQGLQRAEAAKPSGWWRGGAPEEQSLLCPLVSHRLTPNQTSAQASSASNQSWCPSQTPPSVLRPLPQLYSPHDPRVQVPRLLLLENSGAWDPLFLPQTGESRPQPLLKTQFRSPAPFSLRT